MMFESLAQSAQRNVQRFGDRLTQGAVRLHGKLAQELTERWDPGEMYGSLWEPTETVEACRGCGAKFQLLVVRKHHCRVCAGVFCDGCCQTDGPSGYFGGANEDFSRPTRICAGCKRGETPGEHIREAIRTDLDMIRYRNGRENQNIGEQLTMRVAVKMGEAMGVKFADVPPATLVRLVRGSAYGEDGGPRLSKKAPPLSGYFEIFNKSREFFCVKLLIGGGDQKFEVPRPSYTPVPPGGSVGAFFGDEVGELDIIILCNNPCPIPDNSQIIFDTRTPGASAAHISDCAKVENFRHVLYYNIPCSRRNVLLKYKGNGLVQPRRGDSVNRVGLIGKLQGLRFAPDKVDFATNIQMLRFSFEKMT